MKLTQRHIWSGGGVLLASMLLVWAFWPQPVEVEVGAVSRGVFERAVQEDGKTRLRERYVVSSPLTGRVQRITLKQGDAVARDAVLATLWPVMPGLLDERARQEQNERIGALEAAVRRASANVERARAALEQALADLRRSETLAQQGFVSPTQNETGRLTVRLRQKELDSARQEEDAAGHELQQARIAIRTFSAGATGQRSWAIKSPIAGRVLKVNQQSEGLVQAGTALLELGDPGDLEVVVDLLTEDAAQVRPGTPATLANWGGGPQRLNARVRLVEPAAYTKRYRPWGWRSSASTWCWTSCRHANSGARWVTATRPMCASWCKPRRTRCWCPSAPCSRRVCAPRSTRWRTDGRAATKWRCLRAMAARPGSAASCHPVPASSCFRPPASLRASGYAPWASPEPAPADQDGGWQTSTHWPPVMSARRAGDRRTALVVLPAAGSTSSYCCRATSRWTGKGRASPKGQTPPTGCPVSSATTSGGSMRPRPNVSLNLRLSIRWSPAQTSSTTRPSPSLNARVLAMRPGGTPCASAASATVAVLAASSMMETSSWRDAKNSRTDCKLIRG
jgi:HlyD family secretion protein